MSYQVLARKWRPKTFEQMVGQEHVLRALINALDNNRLHHAFLFTGTRGVGKTTIARILAKSLNCEQGISSKPCGQCSACQEIDAGRFVDLIEVDAASRTKVEDTRELLENVQYAPTRGNYKVYLIDEVHMLSNHSFNALLKTLEEPPPHVKFLLATTDPQKLPVTVLSRCLQFNLKRLPQEVIQKHLNHVLTQENVPFEAGAVGQIARGADGSMRDALSLLDQAIAYGCGELKEGEVSTMLGTVQRSQVFNLLSALSRNDGPQLMAVCHELAQLSPDFAAILAELTATLYQLALVQVVPDALDTQHPDYPALKSLADTISAEDIQLYYQIGLLGQRDFQWTPDARTGLEMTLLRMLAFKPAPTSGERQNPSNPGGEHRATSQATAGSGSQAARAILQDIGATNRAQQPPKSNIQPPAHSTPVTPARPAPAPVANRTNGTTPPPAQPVVKSAAANSGGVTIHGNDKSWSKTITELNLTGLARQLAMNCSLKRHDGNTLQLELAPESASLLNPNWQNRLQEALRSYYQLPINLQITIGQTGQATPQAIHIQEQSDRQQAAVDAIETDSNVQSLLKTFDGSITPDSIRPTGEN